MHESVVVARLFVLVQIPDFASCPKCRLGFIEQRIKQPIVIPNFQSFIRCDHGLSLAHLNLHGSALVHHH